MLPLYNDEICPEENEIRSLNLISGHCSGLYSPPNVGWSSEIQLQLLLLSIYKQHQFSWGGPSTWWQQIKWGFIGRECMIMWRLTRRSALKYIFSHLEWCGLLIPLAKMATAATAFQDNSHLTGPALTVRTSQFGSSRSRHRGTLRLSIHLPMSFSITFCLCSKHVHTGSIFASFTKRDEGERWRLKVKFPSPVFLGTACL